jgi:hypothetical protein
MEDVGIFNGHLVHFVVIWYIFPRLGILYREKSGNPGFPPFLVESSRKKLNFFQARKKCDKYIPA